MISFRARLNGQSASSFLLKFSVGQLASQQLCDHLASKASVLILLLTLRANLPSSDLILPHDGQEILWNIIKRPTLCGVHLGPPCGTASKAREIRRKRGPDPRPLRSPNFPDGIPGLGGLARAKVLAANTLYRLTAQVLDYCVVNDIPISVENPLRSYFWDTKHMKRCRRKHQSKLYETVFHHCMYGSE